VFEAALLPGEDRAGVRVSSESSSRPGATESIPEQVEPAASRLIALLDRAARRVALLGRDSAGAEARLRSLRERLSEERFHLAVLGQFNRGKSTLLNALLGEPVLPTSIVPLTAIPTFLRSGPALCARVVLRGDRPPEELPAAAPGELTPFLARFVTEEGNPRNRKGISHVEVFHPSPLLQGVVLIDTPGIGSTYRHNTETTLGFLTQCDAALFLVSADPPMTEVEVDFLKEVRARVVRLFFILNKVDYLSESEQQTAVGFFRKVLKEEVGMEGNVPVFCVSARRALEARLSRDERLWFESGMEEVRRHLVGFLARDKRHALGEAVRQKAQGTLEQVLLQLDLALRSLEMPLDDLERRCRLLEATIEEARRQQTVAGDLLIGDQKRIEQLLEDRAQSLREAASTRLCGVVRETLGKLDDPSAGEKAAHEALAEAIPAFFERELAAVGTEFEDRLRGALQPHDERALALAEKVRRTAAQLFEVPYRAADSSQALEMKREPYWVTRQWSGSLSPLPEGWWERFLPAPARTSRLTRRLMSQVESVVLQNVENLRWAILQNLDLAFRRFRLALTESLAETIAATYGAVEAARRERGKRGEAASAEFARLRLAETELREIAREIEQRF
jgi:GTP-binding protein EngB required for normal cell division